MTTAYLNRIATAVPEHDVHDTFVVFAEKCSPTRGCVRSSAAW
jgi:hypothetical protein